MILLFAFPIADLRGFTGVETHRLSKPPIPAEAGKHFIRDTGIAWVRRQGGSQVAAGEDLYCRARQAALLPRDPAWSYVRQDGCNGRVFCLLRRYFRTGDATSRFEIGFRVVTDPTSCGQLGAKRLVESVAEIPLRVTEARHGALPWPLISAFIPWHRARNSDQADRTARQSPLILAGQALAGHFRAATTKLRRGGQPYRMPDWWCLAGEPLAIIELEGAETLNLPRDSVPLQPMLRDDPNIETRYLRISPPSHPAPIACWFIQIKDPASKPAARQLRMHLVRAHGDLQCLTRVVQETQSRLAPKPGSDAAKRLIRYLETMIGLLEKVKRHGTRQQDILTLAYESQNAATPGALTTLLEKAKTLLDDLKRQERKAEQAMANQPQVWERALVGLSALFIVGLVGYLALRNEPFADQNLVVLVRTMLSLAVAVLGAVIPGFLNISWKGSGLAIRAGGALALFVLTFLLTPQVLPSIAAGHGTDAPAAPVGVETPSAAPD